MGLSFLKEVFDWDFFFVRRISTIAGRLLGLGRYPFAEPCGTILLEEKNV
jgi:hypothetical protein